MTHHDAPAEREAASIRLLEDARARWTDLPPVVVRLDRRDAWAVLLSLQVVLTHPAFLGTAWGATVEAWGRQVQETIDDAEMYAVAEQGWHRDPLDIDIDTTPNPATTKLFAEAFQRWSALPDIKAAAGRWDTFVVLMALQLAVSHPSVGASAMGPVVVAVGRSLQEGLCDDPALYSLAESGWDRSADVAQDQ